MRAPSLAALVLCAGLCSPGIAAGPEDTAMDARVMALAAELRCVVCQNQSLADSHAELAIDLRREIREQFVAGRNEDEVVAFLTQRYGDFVLYRPRLAIGTLVLWFGPFIALLAIAGWAYRQFGRRQSETQS